MVVRLVFSSIMHICYVEVRISRSVSGGPFDFEITRVDCICKLDKKKTKKKTKKKKTTKKKKKKRYPIKINSISYDYIM